MVTRPAPKATELRRPSAPSASRSSARTPPRNQMKKNVDVHGQVMRWVDRSKGVRWITSSS
jgi:hypothetical protein